MMKKHISLIFLIGGVFISGCATTPPPETPIIYPEETQFRPIEAMPEEVAADTIPVIQFRRVCDQIARDLVIQPFVIRSSRPPVVTIRKIENKTGIELDERIFQETIRVRLMEYAQGTVLFRDDESYQDIIKERGRQSFNEINLTLTDSTVSTGGHERFTEREFEGGSLSGMSTGSGKTHNVREESTMEMEQSGTVQSRVADADYFLRGIIYQVKEENLKRLGEGMNYFQYQFRLVDARTGLIVWEKMLSSKMEGKYTLPEEKKDNPR